MSPLEAELLAVGTVIGAFAVLYGCVRFETWLEVHRQVRRFRRQLRDPAAHLHARQPDGSGREPPPG